MRAPQCWNNHCRLHGQPLLCLKGFEQINECIYIYILYISVVQCWVVPPPNPWYPPLWCGWGWCCFLLVIIIVLLIVLVVTTIEVYVEVVVEAQVEVEVVVIVLVLLILRSSNISSSSRRSTSRSRSTSSSNSTVLVLRSSNNNCSSSTTTSKTTTWGPYNWGGPLTRNTGTYIHIMICSLHVHIFIKHGQNIMDGSTTLSSTAL